jgi:hypothetical protein
VTADGFVGAEVPVRVDEGIVTEGLQIKLAEGISLVGQAFLKGTQSPVAGADIFLLPLAEGGEAAASDGARKDAGDRRKEREERRVSRREGETVRPEAAVAQEAAALLRAAMRRGGAQKTDDTGKFQLKEIQAGRYVLVVNHEELVPARIEIEVVADIARFVRVDLDRGEELGGTVELADGSSAAGATVMLRDANGIMKRVTADAAGRYRVQGLVPGTYSFTVRADRSSRGTPVQLQIEKGENRYDYRIEAPAEAR